MAKKAQNTAEIEVSFKNYLNDQGAELIDFVIRGEGGTKLLEVYVDSREVLSIDKLAEFNRELWKIVEEQYPQASFSKIIVSSPGAEKPLKHIWQLIKHDKRTLEFKNQEGKHIEGRIVNVNEPARTVTLDMNVSKNRKKIIKEELQIFKFDELSEPKIKITF